MEAEKVHQEKNDRTPQLVRGGTAQFVDNRPSLLMQRAHSKRRKDSMQREYITQMKPMKVGILQKKAGNIPLDTNMIRQAPRGIIGGGNYERVIERVREYHNDAIIPLDDFGRQIIQLEEIGKHIENWEQRHGPTNQPVKSGLLGIRRQDKRRLVLNNLKNKITVEELAVRQQGKDYADHQHDQDRSILGSYVQQGLSSDDRRLKNSCEWIRAGKTKLYAVTPTGDSYARLVKAGKNPQVDEAFFPEGVFGALGDINSGAVSYVKDDLRDNTNVTLTKTKRTGGWNDPGDPGLIAVVSPAKKSQDNVWETLRHEVQHDADKNKGRDALARYRKAAENAEIIMGDQDFQNISNPNRSIKDIAWQNLLTKYADIGIITNVVSAGGKAIKNSLAEIYLSKYKTEYRAYSYQGGSYSTLDNAIQNQSHDGYMFSERQLAIFKHIYGGYEHTKKGWDNDLVLTDGTKFRKAVQDYWNPDTEAYNKYNSVRIDNFYRALDIIGVKKKATTLEQQHGLDVAPVGVKESDINSPLVQALLKVIVNLDANDLNYILNESSAIFNKIQLHLDGTALQAVENKLRILMRLENIRKSPLYGYSEAYIKMEEKLLAQLYQY